MARHSGPLLPLILAGLAGCAGVQFRVGTDAPPPPEAAARGATPPEETSSAAAGPAPAPDEGKEEASLLSALEFVDAQQIAYKIGAADLLAITVYQEDDMNRKVRVSPDGSITLPLIGSVQVGGLSAAQAESAIHEKLKRYMINPQVSVFIDEYGNKQVYVLGQVKKPGSYPLPTEAPLSVIEAISLAGGFTEYASLDRTRVIRKGGGKSQAYLIDVSAIMKKGDKSKDMELRSNDVIFVPESFF